MKKITLAIIIIIFLGLSTQTQAAWYDWFWKGKKEIPVETKNQGESNPDAIQVAPAKSEPTSDTQKTATETESLKAEIAMLKANLNNLYKAHNELLKYTTEIVAVIRSEIKNTPQAPVESNLESKITSLENMVKGGGGIISLNTRVTEIERKTGLLQEDIFSTSPSDKKVSALEIKLSDLERKINNVCGWIFNGLSISCPPWRVSGENLEDRIEKLERRF